MNVFNHAPVDTTKMVTFVLDVLPRVGRERHLKLVRQQHNELVLVVLQDQLIKILLHMPVLHAKVVPLRVASVLNFLLVQQQHKDLVLVVLQDQRIKIQLHIPVLLVKVVLLRVAEVLDLLLVQQQ